MILTTRTYGRGTPIAQAQNQRVREMVRPAPMVRQTGITAFGSVQQAAGFNPNVNRLPSSFTALITNATGGTLTYVVGDPAGMVAAQTGIAFTALTGVGSGTVASLNQSFGFAPVLVMGVNYSATSGATQFPLQFRFISADFNGQFDAQPIILNEAIRNTAQNANLLTVQFPTPYRLDWNGCFALTVATGQSVQATFFVEAADNR